MWVAGHKKQSRRAIPHPWRPPPSFGGGRLFVQEARETRKPQEAFRPFSEADETFEDPSVTDPDERLLLFGQHDHVRRYGPDYQNRLVHAGFKVTRYSPQDLLDQSDVERFGMSNTT